ncbi:MAG: ATP-binding protein [Vicinamibacterales bacterium]
MTRWWRSHSLRVRLTLWYVFVMLVVLGVYASAVFAFVSRSASDTLDQRLRGDFQWAAAMVDQTPEGRITWYQDDDTTVDEERPWLQVWSTDGRLLFRNIEAELRSLPGDKDLALLADGRIVSVTTDTVPMRVLTRRSSFLADMGAKRVIFQVARSEVPMRTDMRRLMLFLALGLPIAVAVAGFGSYVLARRALKPVEQMTERARTITAERLGDRLPVHNPDDEMGQLALVFNETLSRLEASFEQMRRFTSDASHELRTPLTAIRSVGEVGLRGGHRDESAYRTIIGSMLEEVDRLASLVDRLLTLSRSDTGHAQLSVEDIDLGALAADVVAHLGVLGEEKRQSITIDAPKAVHASGDRLSIRQALINLVDNAIKFSPAGGLIRIAVGETGSSAVIDVSDNGAGVPDEARSRIFDRFYRAPGAVVGAGLGLSIAKGAVEATAGRLVLHRSGPEGSTFRITLPRWSAERDRAAG